MKRTKKILAGILSVSMLMQSALPSAVLTAGAADAAESNSCVLADFTFDEMNDAGNGFEGGNAKATIVGTNVSLQEHTDNGNAVYVGSSSYLDITAADGSSLLTGWDAVTFAFDLKPTSSLSWVLYAAPDTTAPTYPQEKYLGFLKENGSNFVVQRYLNETARPNSASCTLTTGEWNHIEVVVTEPKTVIYVNGSEVSSCDSEYLLSDISKGSGILQLGKANWGGGEYSDMVLDNLKITGTIGDTVTATESLSLTEGKTRALKVSGISSYATVTYAYESSNEAVASVDAQGNVTAVEAGEAVITTKVTQGTAVKTLETAVTVNERPEAQVVASLDFNEESIGDASALIKNFADYTGEISYEDGRTGKAIVLDGYGLRLNKKNVGQNYTVSMWMKHDSVLAENQQILLLGHGDNSSENWLDIAGDRGSNQTYEIWTRNTTSTTAISGWKYLDEDAKQITGEWVMLTVTGDGTDFCAYLNGEQLELNGAGKTDETVANAANILNGDTQDIYVGVNYWDSQFAGLVDDVVVYDQDLTAAEIKTMYEQQYLEFIAEHFSMGDLSAVSDDLTLKTAEGKAAIAWSSDNTDVLANDGTITRQEQDTQVVLTATFTYGSAKIEKTYDVTVKHADATADLEEAYNALTLCTVTAENLNLPAAGKKNTTITWTSDNTEIMTDAGEIVTRPAAGAGNAKVTLTAKISKADQFVTKTFEVEVLEEYYGYIYGYVTGEDDLTGSLHLAYSKDGKNYTALNSNTGIHFAQIATSEGSKNLDTGIRFTEISLFRKADGTFGLAAPQGKDQKKVYLYASKDLLTYTDETLAAANTSVGAVSDVVVKYDAAIDGYYLYWTSNGVQYANTTADLQTLAEAVEASYTVPELTAETTPDGAANGSVIGVTKAEFEKLVNHFAGVSYAETEALDGVTVETAADVAAALPETISLSYDDGSSSAMQVEWDIDTPDFSNAGTYTVTGTLSNYSNPLIEERPDPQIVYDENAKCYYFTSSYPAYGDVNSGYDRLILRKADTIEGLSDDSTEITIWKAPESGTMAKHVWAPELHQIDGTWYVFFAAGNSDNVWAIRPYVLVCQGDDPYDAENWVDENGNAEIHAATSEQSGYFDSMSLDMTYFTNTDEDGTEHHYVIWAELSPSSLYMQEIDPQQPWTGKGEVILLTEPEYGWERDSELVNEGPAILKHDGKIFCTFSASGTGPEYCIGLLYADEDADLMDADSWTKLSYPILTSQDVPGEYGPGHNSFTVDADGNPVFVYHARSEECYQDACAYASKDPLYDPCRQARVKNVHWSKDGLPILNTSADVELPEAAKTVTIQVTINQDTIVQRELSEATIAGVETVVETGEQNCPEISVTWGTAALTENVDYTVTYGENKNGTGTVTITAVEGGRYTGSKTAEFKILASVIADFDFDDLKDGLTGGNAAATVAGGSIELVEHEDGYAAKFVASEKDYLNVTAKDGSSLLTDYEEITISYDIIPETSGSQWVFYAAEDDTMLTWGNNGNYEKYLGVLVKDGIMEIERYNNNGSRPTKPTVALEAGKWQHVDIVYAKDCTVLYVDGVRVSKVDTTYQLTDILGDTSLFQIGKANWSPGEYSTMQMDNFKIVAGTKLYEDDKLNQTIAEIEETLGDVSKVTTNLNLLTESSDGLTIQWSSDNTDVVADDGTITVPENKDTKVTLTAVITNGTETTTKTYEVTVLASGNVINKVAEELTLPYSTEEGKEVYGNITLPNSVNGVAEITWTTNHPEIVNVNAVTNEDYDDTPAGVVTRPQEDTEVTLTAEITLGGKTVEKSFTVMVKAAPQELTEDDYTDYFFAYFTGEGYSNGEQIYFSASHDGLHWKDLNDNEPALTSTLGEKGVRDPFIIRSAEGDKFYLIATDLKINGGNGWTAAQEAGSQSLMVWESTDLVNWSDQRMVEVSVDIEAGCTWAPEATYDERTGEYVVYWASKVAGDGYAKQRLYYAKTRDFYSFTEPQVYIEKDQSSIDTTMIEYNGTYYRYTKNEGGSTNELGALTKTIFVEKSSDVLGTFTHISSDTLNSSGNQYVEGPTIFKFNKDDMETDTWCLLVDDFGGGGYYPLITTDLESGEFTKLTTGYQLPGGTRYPRHGTPIAITAEEFAAVAAAYNMDTLTVDELIEEIDNLEVKNNDTAALEELEDTYQVLSDEEKAQVGAERYEKLAEALKLAKLMKKDGIVVEDQSANGYDFDFAAKANATFTDSVNEGTYMSGYADVDNEGAQEVFDSLFNGTQPFTIEMEVNPNGYGEGGSDYNLLFSKGDDCAALRVSENKAYFHIKDSSGWKSATVSLTEAQMSSWIHVAAVYDGSQITVYADGKTASTATGGILSSVYPAGIGYCKQTSRYGQSDIRSIHIYNKALTTAQLDAGSVEASDASVVLWYDFDNYSYGVQAETIRVSEESLDLQVEETAQLSAEIHPYYAEGTVAYASENEAVAQVSESGEVTAVAEGSTVIRVSVEGQKAVYAEIPVTVTDPNKASQEEIKALRSKILEIECDVLAEAAYTEESYAAYSLALANAKEILKKDYLTTEEVQAAQAELTEAYEKLEKDSEIPPLTALDPIERETEPTEPDVPGPNDPIQTETITAPEAQAVSKNYCTIKISWTKVEAAKEYVVYRKAAKGGQEFEAIATVDASKLTYNDKKAELGVKYEYAVQAKGLTANSSLSAGVTCKAVPGVPKLKAKASSSGVKLTWKKVKVAKKKKAVSYRIYRKAGNGKWKKVAVVAGSKTTWTDTKVKKGQTYTYRAVALAKKGKKTIVGSKNKTGVKVKAK